MNEQGPLPASEKWPAVPSLDAMPTLTLIKVGGRLAQIPGIFDKKGLFAERLAIDAAEELARGQAERGPQQ